MKHITLKQLNNDIIKDPHIETKEMKEIKARKESILLAKQKLRNKMKISFFNE